MKAALEANATVNALFNVLVDNDYDGTTDLCKSANPKVQHQLLPQAEDDFNYGSKVRIVRSSSVTAPR